MSAPAPKRKPLVSKAIRELPKHYDIPCTLREPGCNYMPTVLCHVRNIRELGGNKKPNDTSAFYGCDHCHKLQEARKVDPQHVLEAVLESLGIMLQHGVLSAEK